MKKPHDYVRYTTGCRCAPCRAAKAAYMRAKRAAAAEARAAGETPYVSHGISGYQDAGCRCDICRAAKSVAGRRETRKKGAA